MAGLGQEMEDEDKEIQRCIPFLQTMPPLCPHPHHSLLLLLQVLLVLGVGGHAGERGAGTFCLLLVHKGAGSRKPQELGGTPGRKRSSKDSGGNVDSKVLSSPEVALLFCLGPSVRQAQTAPPPRVPPAPQRPSCSLPSLHKGSF